MPRPRLPDTTLPVVDNISDSGRTSESSGATEYLESLIEDMASSDHSINHDTADANANANAWDRDSAVVVLDDEKNPAQTQPEEHGKWSGHEDIYLIVSHS